MKNKKIITTLEMINGPNTELVDIQSIKLSSETNDLFVLNAHNGENRILVFNCNRSGNIKPRIIEHPSLYSAKNFTVGDNNQLFILNKDEIIKVDATSNSKSTIESQKPRFTQLIKNQTLKDAEKLYFSEGSLLVLDKKNSKLFIIDSVNRTIASNIELKESNLENPSHIKVNKKTKSFKVFNDKSFIEFK